MIRPPLSALVLWGLLLLTPALASAQLEAPTRLQEVDPGPVEPDLQDEAVDTAEAPEEEPEGAQPEDDEDEAPRKGARGARGKAPAEPVPVQGAPGVPSSAAPQVPEGPVPPPVARPTLAPVLAPRVTDAEILAVWDRWRQARATNDQATADQAQNALGVLKTELQAADLEPISVGFLRESLVRRRAGDMPGALRLGELAVRLSPRLPMAHFMMAETYAADDPVDVGRYLGALRVALVSMATDPRYRGPALVDLGALLLVAWAGTTGVLVALLFVRRVRYALHDFHHLLPRSVARWQSALLGLLLLGLPLTLGVGLLPLLLLLLGVVVPYLTRAERIVAAVLVAGLGLAPLAAGQLARVTAFAGTPAEDVSLLERGGLAAEAAAARVQARQSAGKATFFELTALGQYETRRGLLEEARGHFKAASALRSRDARLLTRFGNALVGLGDDEGAAQLYVQASNAEPTLAAPHYNLSMIYRRRAKTLPDAQVGAELDRAATATAAAQALDGELLRREPPPDERLLLNQLMLSPPLSASEWMGLADGAEDGARVEGELTRWLLPGVSPGPVSWGLAAVVAVVLVLWGTLAQRLKAAQCCERCGRPVCVRCDPELAEGSKQCGQCVNVFSRRGLVPQKLRQRKADQVGRHQAWVGRVTYAAGVLLSGAGHVVAGGTVRGVLYAFFFFFALAASLLHHGLMRVPYGEAPMYLKLVPAVLLLVIIHLSSISGLRRLRRGE
ncbi:tetratricopeptide repeat protein [Myxococcus sp. K15C18031901]|uniref:tetratricopeptide repeat protein n=1 Tax=Myxococcus dinghuensis TaxID=2906761 RepID=UPI0020A7C9EA|nr:tetratricopeptide repeat protein [Myxococcus dinghuensis]MCP3101419.1 tetratricopeptide repeat protein [Myxococcus dinghuensis]